MKDGAKFCPKCGAQVCEPQYDTQYGEQYGEPYDEQYNEQYDTQYGEYSGQYEQQYYAPCEAPAEPVNTSKKKNRKTKKDKKPVKKWKVITACVCSFAILVSGILGGLYWYFNKPVYSPDNNYVFFEEGFTDVKVTDEASALEAIASVGDVLGISSVKKELKSQGVNTVDGDSYYRFQQMYNDIPVYGRSVVISAKSDGTATALTSNAINLSGESFKNNKKTDIEYEEICENYLTDDLQIAGVDKAEFLQNGEYIYTDYNGKTYLCHSVIAVGFNETKNEYYNYELLINTKNNKVIYCNSLMNYNNYADVELFNCNSEKVPVNVTQNGSNYDFVSSNNIFVYTPTEDSVIWYLDDENERTLVSVPTDFKDASQYSDVQKSGVDCLNKLSMIINKYETVCGNKRENEPLYCYVDVENFYYPAINEVQNIKGYGAFYTNWVDNDLIALELGEYDAKLLGHEYTHYVTSDIPGFVPTLTAGNQPKALNEAYADILGTLLTAENNQIDIEKLRYSKNGKKIEIWCDRVEYPIVYSDLITEEELKREEYNLKYDSEDFKQYMSHLNCTIINRAAYLMWNGVDGKCAAISNTDILAKLWYRSSLMLQSDATFSQCRNAVELSARIMVKNGELTEEQYKCVVQAFVSVGVTKCLATYSKAVKNDFDLSVLSYEKSAVNANKDPEELWYNLTVLKLSSNEPVPTLLDDSIIETGSMKKVFDQNFKSGKQRIHMKDGTYLLCFKDLSKSGENTKTIYMYITVDGENKEATDKVTVYTDFTSCLFITLKPDAVSPDTQSKEDIFLYIPELEKIIAQSSDKDENYSGGILYDTDGDGISELVVDNDADFSCHLYDVENGKAIDKAQIDNYINGIVEYQNKIYYYGESSYEDRNTDGVTAFHEINLYETANLATALSLSYKATITTGKNEWQKSDYKFNGNNSDRTEFENVLKSIKYLNFDSDNDWRTLEITGAGVWELLEYLKQLSSDISASGQGNSFKTTENELRMLFANSIGYVNNVYCDDFDNDGIYEAFAVTGAVSDWDSESLEGVNLFFAKQDAGKVSYVQHFDDLCKPNGIIDKGDYKVILFETYATDSDDSVLYVYGVKNGKAEKIDFSGDNSYQEKIDKDKLRQAEEECRSAFTDLCHIYPRTIYCDDYDGDGTYEAFALIEVNGYNGSLNRKGMAVCYAKNGVAYKLDVLEGEANFTYNGEIQSGKYKFFSFEQDFGGSGSKSFVLGVKNGQVTVMNVSGQVMNFKMENGKITGCYNDFSTGTHHYSWYEFSLDEERFRFDRGENVDYL